MVTGEPMTTLYLHYEESSPEFTMKCTVGGEALGAAAVLERFAHAYSKQTGSPLAPGRLHLRDSRGAAITCGALLPCGLSNGADLFVSVEGPPTADAPQAAAPPAVMPAAPAAASSWPARVTAKEGSAIASSQARMGEHSYYYSVGKAGDPERPPVPQPQRTCVERVAAGVPEATISSFSFEDTDAFVKLHIPLAGAASLPAGAIRCDVRHRSFDLRVTTAGRLLRLHVRALRPRRCTASRAGRLHPLHPLRPHGRVWQEDGGCVCREWCVMCPARRCRCCTRRWSQLAARSRRGRASCSSCSLRPRRSSGSSCERARASATPSSSSWSQTRERLAPSSSDAHPPQSRAAVAGSSSERDGHRHRQRRAGVGGQCPGVTHARCRPTVGSGGVLDVDVGGQVRC